MVQSSVARGALDGCRQDVALPASPLLADRVDNLFQLLAIAYARAVYYVVYDILGQKQHFRGSGTALWLTH